MPALRYETSKRGYFNLWEKARIKPSRLNVTHRIAKRLNSNKQRYQHAAIGDIPWYWVAITHSLESGANFTRHLHNGDSLKRRTRRVPAGRPKKGTPPFTWEESAQDALQMKQLDKIKDWNISRILFEFERYNGFGYVARRINSPYLWSYTNQYSKGKYVSDGKFSRTAVSRQCGAAAVLKAMIDLRLVTVPKKPITKREERLIQFDKPVASKKKPTKRPEWDVIGWIVTFIRSLF